MSVRRILYPLLDPPGEQSWFRRHIRAATRDRTPWNGPDEYVCTVDADGLARALRDAGYRTPPLTTLKYVTTRDGEVAWEQGTAAAGLLDRGGENQHHAYWFRGEGDTRHVHHHREWPTIGNPMRHQHGSRTHGDPDGRLRGALDTAGIDYGISERPSYEPL